MSILAAATQPATSPAATPADVAGLIYLAVTVALSAVGLVIAWRLGGFASRRVLGPRRLPSEADVWPLVIATGATFFGVIGGSLVGVKLGNALEAVNAKSDATAVSDLAGVIAGLGGSACAVACGLLVLAALDRRLIGWLGLSPGRVSAGVLAGLLATVVIPPWTSLVGIGVEQLYQWVGFRHPAEHELLKVMAGPDAAVKVLAILSAVVGAPLAEELFFRGLIQTALLEFLSRASQRPMPAVDPPAITIQPGVGPTATGDSAQPVVVLLPPPPPPPTSGPLPDATSLPPLDPIALAYATPAATVRPPPKPWMAWAAIIVTATLFALVHPMWTAPIIFFLALGLGYVYERTGNLWATITLHAAFNAINVMLYLSGPG